MQTAANIVIIGGVNPCQGLAQRQRKQAAQEAVRTTTTTPNDQDSDDKRNGSNGGILVLGTIGVLALAAAIICAFAKGCTAGVKGARQVDARGNDGVELASCYYNT